MTSPAGTFLMTADQHRALAARIRKEPTLDPDERERLAKGHELAAQLIEARKQRQPASSSSSPASVRSASAPARRSRRKGR